jgi:hypothetical protein
MQVGESQWLYITRFSKPMVSNVPQSRRKPILSSRLRLEFANIHQSWSVILRVQLLRCLTWFKGTRLAVGVLEEV